MKENVLLLRDLLEHWRTRFLNIWQLFQNTYFDVLDNIVNKYNNTVHETIKMKPIDVTDDYYAKYNEDFNKKAPKFKVGDHARISKYKNIFAKGYNPNWSELLVINKIKIQLLGLMLLVTWVVKELLEVFMKKNYRKLVEKNLE